MLCKLMESLLFARGGPDFSMDPNKLNILICTTFVFCFLWSIGGNIIDSNWDAFDTFVRQQFDDNGDAKVCILFRGKLYSKFSFGDMYCGKHGRKFCSNIYNNGNFKVVFPILMRFLTLKHRTQYFTPM